MKNNGDLVIYVLNWGFGELGIWLFVLLNSQLTE